MKNLKVGKYHIEFKYQAFIMLAFIFTLFLFYDYYLINQRMKPVVTVLMFHSVDPKGPSAKEENGVIITPEKLSNQIKYFKLKGYNFIDTNQLVNILNNPIPSKSGANKKILITFDDGYRDNYTHAYPVLKKEKVSAIINIVAYYVEHPNVAVNGIHIPNRYLLWSHINEMQKDGIIQIGSHSYNSHYYTELSFGKGPLLAGRRVKNGMVESDLDFKERVRMDMLKSLQVIKKHTNHQPQAIAYPYGCAAPETKAIAKELEFKIQMTVRSGINSKVSDLENLKRITVKNSFTPEQIEKQIKFCTGARLLLP